MFHNNPLTRRNLAETESRCLWFGVLLPDAALSEDDAGPGREHGARGLIELTPEPVGVLVHRRRKALREDT